MATTEVVKTLMIGGVAYETSFTRKFEQRRQYTEPDPRRILCVIPGVILRLYVHSGMRVLPDERLLVLEAMKMQNDVHSPCEGTVRAVHVAVGDAVMKGQLLVELA